MEPHEQWLVGLAAVASVGGITGVWLLWWAWIDRPQHAWNVRISRELDEQARQRDVGHTYEAREITDRHKVTVAVRPIGTAIAHDVQVRVRGAHPFNASNGLRAMHMSAASDPIEFDVGIPAERDNKAVFAEVTWVRIRPHHHVGQRINLRTQRWEFWHWYWHSVRFQRWRIVRTKGRWVERKRALCPEIPVPDE